MAINSQLSEFNNQWYAIIDVVVTILDHRWQTLPFCTIGTSE